MSNVPFLRLVRRNTGAKTIQELLEQHEWDFNVSKRTMFIRVKDENDQDKYIEVPNFAAVTRDDSDDPLSVNGARYGVVQFREALDFLNEIAGDGRGEFYYAAMVDGGAKMHVIMKTPDFIELKPGERIDCFFTVSTSHDGTGTMSAMCTPIHNLSQTVFTPTSSRKGIDTGVCSVRHTAHAKRNMDDAAKVMRYVTAFWTEYSDTVSKLANTRLSDSEARVYLRGVIEGNHTRSKNVREKIETIYKTNPVCRNHYGNLFGIFLAVQIYADMYKTVRRSITGRNEVDARIQARLEGDGAKTKAEAYATAKRMFRLFEINRDLDVIVGELGIKPEDK